MGMTENICIGVLAKACILEKNWRKKRNRVTYLHDPCYPEGCKGSPPNNINVCLKIGSYIYYIAAPTCADDMLWLANQTHYTEYWIGEYIASINILMYYNVIFLLYHTLLSFYAFLPHLCSNQPTIFKSTYDIVTQLLLTFVILCVAFGRSWSSGNDKYYAFYVIHVKHHHAMYRTHLSIVHFLYFFVKYLSINNCNVAYMV